ncbi:MAG: aldo/keto reductase [Spirochaetales bacterium]|uniref:Aldo/keto reductase n=1 Tax=Candidatus Thalassospirochaeta sargassi TaxID=3119039 RepID=A0AAJ1MIV2_9SPIO|nr:aldo/keto reductase [Spirochaetales bacterium]
MKYRDFGKTGAEVSVLGFGCMRLPLVEGSDTDVDFEESRRIIRRGIDLGVNYIDTAWPYHNGMSEEIVGRVLEDGYREKVYIATKMPSWLVKGREDMDDFLDRQLERLQTDYIDFYLIHTLNKMSWSKLKELGLFDFIEKAKASGKIRHIGFSFHDELPVFKEIVDGYDWEFTQIQYNFMDTEYQAGREGLEYAAARGLGIVVMEPLRGGSFLKNIPDDIQALWDACEAVSSAADAALKWVWNHDEVGLLLSGMGTMEQVIENCKSADEAAVHSLDAGVIDTIERVRDIYHERIIAPCTNCKYCMPCPSGVDIPSCLNFLNNTSVYNSVDQFRVGYRDYFSDDKKADNCIECGQCEEACPQHIQIIEHLKQLDSIMK